MLAMNPSSSAEKTVEVTCECGNRVRVNAGAKKVICGKCGRPVLVNQEREGKK